MANNLLTVDDLCRRLKVGENTVYQLLKSGQVGGFKVGQTWRVPQDNLNLYFSRKLEEKKGTSNNECL